MAAGPIPVQQPAVKVVYIDTRYVDVDPLSFKSVVQSLTGKDSSAVDIAWMTTANSSISGQKRKRCRGGGVSASSEEYCCSSYDKGFEGLLMELPPRPMEELRWLWSESKSLAT
ncbi:VQ motif-containing protein 1-like [Diospyros lotus]|uniref:VQ motif-containing protein 1-like n=1 Tax=Diospyros lotus TaxID=55363 RepID=UPI0022512B1B|nr:VQ motif-containing protein 1-like [Diospyros lotus]